MAEQLKSFFSPSLVKRLAHDLHRVHPKFPVDAFVRRATRGLTELELVGRGRHIALTLAEHLPQDFPKAVDILLRSLGPEHTSDELTGSGMGPFYYLPHTIFVAERGLEHFDLALEAQYELTKRFTAEWSIRTFLALDPERTLKKLKSWAKDKNPHVRRLVSEGTRLRLPWGSRVRWLDANPERVLGLLELLRGDPSSLVRRSVANNLNDLSKDHPALVLDTCRRWLSAGTPETEALVRHALRSLVKKGNKKALSLLGVGATPRVAVSAPELAPKLVRVGGELRFVGSVESQATRPQELALDYIVHFIKANGAAKPKVFKLKRLILEAGSTANFQGKVSFQQLTTRKHYPGRHRLELLINGVTFPFAEFDVRA